jgi:hypothetical protein
LLNTKPDFESPQKTLQTDLTAAAFDLFKHELTLSSTFANDSASSSLDSILKLNRAILQYYSYSPIKPEIFAHYSKSQVYELMQASLEFYCLNKKPFLLTFDKFKRNIRVSKMI